jgi:zinc transporter ZupT
MSSAGHRQQLLLRAASMRSETRHWRKIVMPAPIKFALSVIVALVAFALFECRGMMSPDLHPLLIPALGAFMIFSLWVFPEASKREGRSQRKI